MGEPIASRIWGLPKMVPSNGWFIMENTIAGWFMKTGDLPMKTADFHL